MITGSPTEIQIQTNDRKHAKIRFQSKRPHTITQNITMDSTIAGSKNARS